MQLHNLKSKTRKKRHKIIGRGGKRGKTSGRGGKGQTARAGAKVRPQLREVIKKLPKLRGYRFKSYRPKPAIVNLKDLGALFSSGDTVSPAALKAVGLVRAGKEVKILGEGRLGKKLIISGCLVSKSAREKIEKAGGTISNE